MSYDFRTRLEAFYDYIRVQLSEASTITGLLTLATISFGVMKDWQPGAIAILAGVVSALCKIFLPDDLARRR
jgi:hypothetical protein